MKEDIPTMEAEIARAVEADLKRVEGNVRQWPLAPTGKPVEGDSPPEVSQDGTEPRLAADQLSLAVAGLLRIEQELAKLTEELVGPLAEEMPKEKDRPGPILDRVRHDAKLLARMALRLDKRIRFIREKL